MKLIIELTVANIDEAIRLTTEFREKYAVKKFRIVANIDEAIRLTTEFREKYAVKKFRIVSP